MTYRTRWPYWSRSSSSDLMTVLQMSQRWKLSRSPFYLYREVVKGSWRVCLTVEGRCWWAWAGPGRRSLVVVLGIVAVVAGVAGVLVGWRECYELHHLSPSSTMIGMRCPRASRVYHWPSRAVCGRLSPAGLTSAAWHTAFCSTVTCPRVVGRGCLR